MVSKVNSLLLTIIAICAVLLTLSRVPRKTLSQPEKTVVWEYQVFELYPDTTSKFFHDSLNQLGQMGWEMVEFSPVTSSIPSIGSAVTHLDVVFKRQKRARSKEEELQEGQRILKIIQDR